jgi:RNA polymerase sigma-70 factor, ECF subfamily
MAELMELDIDTVFISNPDKAFEMLYNKYYNQFCNASYKMVQDREAAEDVVQEVIMELWSKRENIQFTTSIIAYLRRAIYNRSINYIKQKAKFSDDDSALVNFEDRADSVEESLYAEQLNSKLQLAIESLPEKCKYVFVLSRYEQKSYNEIAEALEISVKTVENQISKALKVIRNYLINSEL